MYSGFGVKSNRACQEALQTYLWFVIQERSYWNMLPNMHSFEQIVLVASALMLCIRVYAYKSRWTGCSTCTGKTRLCAAGSHSRQEGYMTVHSPGPKLWCDGLSSHENKSDGRQHSSRRGGGGGSRASVQQSLEHGGHDYQGIHATCINRVQSEV